MRFFIFSLIMLINFFIFSAHGSDLTEKHFDPFLARAFDRTSFFLYATGTASVLLTKPSDDRIREQWVSHQQMSEKQSHVGDLLGSGLAGIFLVGGQALWDEDQDHYQSHARALIYTTVSTYTLKTVFGRQRPGNSDSHQSFPSGHTSTAFATATSLTYAYGWKAALVAYPVAAFVGLSRLADDAHWASDLVGGAFLGFIMARASNYEWSDSENKILNSNTQFILNPIIHGDELGMTVTYIY
ncbi:MAG: phosphatase PAP2 family protein [Pseudobdellovibrio sp.]